MPTDDDEEDEDGTDTESPHHLGAGEPEGVQEGTAPAPEQQKLVRLPRRTRARPPAPPKRSRAPKPAVESAMNDQPIPSAGVQPPPPVAAPPAPTTVAATPALPTSGLIDPNILFLFEETVRAHPMATFSIYVKRLTGREAGTTWMLDDRPMTASELWQSIKRLHGQSEGATYEVSFRDSSSARGVGGTGQVSMPNTQNDPRPPGQHYPPPQPGQPYPLPQPAPQAPPPPSTVFDANAMLAMQRQWFEMMQQMQTSKVAPLPMVAPPPPVAPALDPSAMLAMQREWFEMMQQAQQTATVPMPPPPQAPAMPAQPVPAPTDPTSAMLAMPRQWFEQMMQMMGGAGGRGVPAPAAPAPASTNDGMLAFQRQTFDMMLEMMRAAQRPVAGAGAPPPYRPDRGDPRYRPDPGAPPYAPPPPPKTMKEELRDAVNVMRTTFDVAREFGFGQAPAPVEREAAPDDPVRVVHMGLAKSVVNVDDGSMRVAETILSNLPEAAKWAAQQFDKIREARGKQQQRTQLPPGYVEVGPGYQPPPGYVAVPIDQIPPGAPLPAAPLPEPPADMPPPITEPRRTNWGMPPGGSQ